MRYTYEWKIKIILKFLNKSHKKTPSQSLGITLIITKIIDIHKKNFNHEFREQNELYHFQLEDTCEDDAFCVLTILLMMLPAQMSDS